MCYAAQLTSAANDFHERRFPDYASDFLRTDPDLIERFDDFAFDEAIVTTPLLNDCKCILYWLVTCASCVA